MDQPSQDDRPLPSLDDFEMYFKTEIRPAVARIFRQRRTLWERTNKPQLALVVLPLLALVVLLLANLDVALTLIESLGVFLIIGILILTAAIGALVFQSDDIEDRAALEVARRSTTFFGWSTPAPVARRSRLNHFKAARILSGSVETTWAAQRIVGGANLWMCDARIEDDDTELFKGFLAGIPVAVPPKLKIIANAISPSSASLTRSFNRLAQWMNEGGYDEVRTGNKEFDKHFVVHSNDTEYTNRLLSYLFMQRALGEQNALRQIFETQDVDISFAFNRGMFLLAIDSGRRLIPSDFDYTRTEDAIPIIHESFVAVEHLIDNLIVPLQDEVAKLKNS